MGQLRKGQIGKTLAGLHEKFPEFFQSHLFLGAGIKNQLRRRLINPGRLVQSRIAGITQPQLLGQRVGAVNQVRQQIDLIILCLLYTSRCV